MDYRVIPTLFLLVGYVLTIILMVFYYLNKHSYFWQLASGFISILYILGLGSWMIFTGLLAKTLQGYVPIYITVLSSFLFCSIYAVTFFMKYYNNFNKNEGSYLQGIDVEKGIIDPHKTRFYRNKIGSDEIGKSSMTLPIRIFVFILAPIGGGGCGLLMRHVGSPVQFIVLAIAMYVLTIAMIAGGMHGYFSLYILAKLQIKHRKCFRLAE